MAKRMRRLLPLVLAGLLALGACTTIGGGPPQSTETAEFTGPSAHLAIVEAYGGVYRHAELERALTRIVSRLIAASEEPERAYTITMLNSAAVNAFALPDGYLYVTRGLIALANDASELAAVLAHEMAHITADHATERRNQALTAAILDNAVGEAVQDPAAVQAAVVTGQQTLAGFSRQQEFEADIIGIRTVALAGYDPYAAARFLSAMSRYQNYRESIGIQQNRQPDFIASHPTNQDRIDAATATAQAFGPPGIGETDREAYLAALDGVIFGDDAGQGFVRGRVFYHPELAIAFAVADGFTLDNTHEAVLATAGDGLALRFDSVGVAPGLSLADYVRSGWVNGLDTASVRDLTINGLPAAAASATAAGWFFRITVVRAGSATYRFIFASDVNTADFDAVAAAIAGSFRQLTAQEVVSLRPLRIDTITVGAGDTLESLAARMRGIERPLDLFLVLNGLEPGAIPAPGSMVKIVID